MDQSKIAVDSPSGANLSRKSLIKRLLGVGVVGWLGSLFYPIFRFLVPPPIGEAHVSSLKVGAVDDVWEKPFKIIQYGRKPVIILKDQNGEIKALSALCTHLACIVQYKSEENFIWCACHNGKFDLSGKVIAGPPPEPLENYDVNITDSGEVWVSQQEA